MEKLFKGKNVIVTGGASGIGASIARQLIVYGAHVIIIDRTPLSDQTAYIQANLADIDEARSAFNRAISQMKHIDYIINSAGIFMAGEIYDTPIENWHIVIDNNIYAVGHSAHLAYRYMVEQGNGHIVNIASTAGLIPVPAMGIYGISKYALVGLSHAMRNEGSALGVKVSVACPTIVNTPLYESGIYNNVDKARVLQSVKKHQSPEVAAQRILKGIKSNRATIHTSFLTAFIWHIHSLFPHIYDATARKTIRMYRSKLRQQARK